MPVRNSINRRRCIIFGAVLAAGVALVAGGSVASASTPGTHHPAPPKPTVVLVHGAWADSGSWDGVIAALQRDGYPVEAFPTPLDSLWGDSAALRDYLDAISGPVVLVGHSYGGAVITDAATGDANVKALVYVDAFAPKEGQTVMDLPGAGSALADPAVFKPVPATVPLTASTELYVNPDAFVADFANDMSRARGAQLAATQRPITVLALNQPSTAPAWASIPSWYEVGTIDKVIPQAVQLATAKQIGAHIIQVRTGHLPMVSNPRAVTSLIETAAHATA